MDDEIMRRRAFLAGVLLGIAVPPGVLDSAARLEPVAGGGSLARQVAELEETVHLRALDFPTVPSIDQLPRLVRDYAGFRRVSYEAPAQLRFRIESALGQLCAFAGGNLADWQDYDAAHAWYGEGLIHARRGGAREVAAWIAARGTLMPVHQGDARQAIHDAAYAVMLSPPGQLGSTLGNALAASTLAKIGHREAALKALDSAQRAVDRQDDLDTFTAYSMPWYRLGRFTSETYTALGEFDKARHHQDQSLGGYPPDTDTDTTYLRMDRAETMAREGYRDAATDEATEAILRLSPGKTAPILLDRAGEVGKLLGSDGEPLRETIRARR